jgi:tRNA-dihydrouridine synthase
MDIYFAPMEGMTPPLLRTLHNEFFGGCDKYFTPFISTNENYSLNQKEKKDIDPALNEGLNLVPQIISNSAEQSAGYIFNIAGKYDYKEININMGCPSGTVVSKNKGSGMLKDKQFLKEYMDELFSLLYEKENRPVPDISIKTRIGFYSEDEHRQLTDLILAHPVKQVIIHPRSRVRMYEGSTNLDAFSYMYDALTEAGIGVVYNGDIKTPEDYEAITKAYPKLDAVMIGRGLLADPSLARRIKGGKCVDNEEYLSYMEALLNGYADQLGNDKHILAKMKDLWNLAKPAFSGNEKGYKDMCKADTLERYRVCMKQFIRNSKLL